MNALKFWLLTVLMQWAIQVESGSSNTLHALILARGGSKGIPSKNLAQIDGSSLLSRTISVIKNANRFDHIWVSTDNEEIAEEAKKYGALVHNRPRQYAADDTPSIEAVKQFLEVHTGINYFSLFQCTSVFLNENYIRKAVHAFKSHDCVFAVKRSHNLRWKSVKEQILPDNFKIEARPRRQDWEGDMVEAGMFYFSSRDLVMQGLLQNDDCAVVEIADEDGLEIDTPRDLTIARCIEQAKNGTVE